MDSFELVIFDCDGVLVDSEQITNEVFARVLHEECGMQMSLDQMYQTFVGRSSAQCLTILEAMLGGPPPPGFEARCKTEITEALQSSVTAVAGVEQTLQTLDIPWCVASGGSHQKMRTTLGRAGLWHYFEGRLHSTDDVARGKPWPDVYLYAAARMGAVLPERCLVIEDSPTGVEGAVAAGMTVFGYTERVDEQRLRQAGAHHTFSDMAALVAEIDAWEV